MNTIRRAKPEDARGIHDAHMNSIKEVCARDHSQEEIAGWGNRPFREDQRLAAIEKHCVWVVEHQEKIEGYCHLGVLENENTIRAHIFGLYLTAKVVGCGLGKQLLDLMIKEAVARGAAEITLESTITAHEFYKANGFRNKGPLVTVQIGGSSVRCQPMSLHLRSTN